MSRKLIGLIVVVVVALAEVVLVLRKPAGGAGSCHRSNIAIDGARSCFRSLMLSLPTMGS